LSFSHVMSNATIPLTLGIIDPNFRF
jgi:hypothetical protein